MPAEYEQTFRGAFTALKDGNRIIQQLHEDIDESALEISCRSGSCEVRLEERIWWTWSRAKVWRLKAGRQLRTSLAVDSEWFDGDHRLSVVATADGASVDVRFTSRTVR